MKKLGIKRKKLIYEKNEKMLKQNNRSKKTNTFSRSILTKVFFLAAILILIAVTVNYLSSSYYSKKMLLENTKSSLYDLADAHSTTVEKSILSINNALIGLAGESAISDYVSGLESKPTESSRVCQSYLIMHDEVDTCSIIDDSGTVLYSTNSTEINKSYEDQEFVKQALERGIPTQSSVVTASSSQTNGIVFAYPVRSYLGDVEGLVTVTIPVSKLFENLKSVSVFGTENSYAFLIDAQGNILFHKNPDLIGTQVNNQKIMDIKEKLLNNDESANQSEDKMDKNVIVDTYTEDGKTKQISCGVIPDNKWTLIVTADEKEITKPVTDLSVITFITSIIMIVILSFLAFLFANSIVKPIKKIINIIDSTASLDLAKTYEYTTLLKSKDETAAMAKAMQKLRIAFIEIVDKIKNSSNYINDNATELNQIMNLVKDSAESTAASTQELSASMEETFATAQEISSSIVQMDDSTKDIALQIKDGTVLSKNLAKRAEDIKENTTASSSETKEIYNNMKDKTKLAIKKAESVSKINTLANGIKEIAEQTSLLSLNASIEAARAGESGKGFQVVASEIGQLASQSSETVNNITAIVAEVNETVKELTENLETTLEFLDKNVLRDYESFISVSEQYSTDAFQMNDTITSIHNSVKIVIQYMDTISNAVSGITSNVGAATSAVNDIAQGNNKIMELTLDTHEKIKESEENAVKLEEVVNQFQMP